MYFFSSLKYIQFTWKFFKALEKKDLQKLLACRHVV